MKFSTDFNIPRSPPITISTTTLKDSSSVRCMQKSAEDKQLPLTKCIVYLEPAQHSNFYQSIVEYYDISKQLYGPNEAHWYHPHCSLTGFFLADPDYLTIDRCKTMLSEALVDSLQQPTDQRAVTVGQIGRHRSNPKSVVIPLSVPSCVRNAIERFKSATDKLLMQHSEAILQQRQFYNSIDNTRRLFSSSSSSISSLSSSLYAGSPLLQSRVKRQHSTIKDSLCDNPTPPQNSNISNNRLSQQPQQQIMSTTAAIAERSIRIKQMDHISLAYNNNRLARDDFRPIEDKQLECLHDLANQVISLDRVDEWFVVFYSVESYSEKLGQPHVFQEQFRWRIE